MILQSLAGLPAFLVYFCTAIIAVVAYLFVYTRVTAHNEFDLIRANEPAAAIALGLSLLGFALPLVSAISHSANVWDCLIWATIALIVFNGPGSNRRSSATSSLSAPTSSTRSMSG
jgi:putative membrane protein